MNKFAFLAASFIVLLLTMRQATEAKMTPLPNDYYLIERHLEKGWNIVHCLLPTFIQPGSELTPADVKGVWIYVPQFKKMYQAYPENELGTVPVEIGRQISEAQLLSSSCWVYSSKSGNISYKADEPMLKLHQRKMYRGWNFVTISPEFKMTPLGDLQGSCNIKKIATWQQNEWEVGTPDTMPDGNRPWNSLILADSDSAIGRGVLFSMESDCFLTDPGSAPVRPPALP